MKKDKAFEDARDSGLDTVDVCTGILAFITDAIFRFSPTQQVAAEFIETCAESNKDDYPEEYYEIDDAYKESFRTMNTEVRN